MDFHVLKDWKTKDGYRVVAIQCKRGHNCGYVGVNYKHPLYRKSYSSNLKCLKAFVESADTPPLGDIGNIPLSPRMDDIFDVHGGVTFANGGKGSEYPVTANLWWIGFDCAHAGDTRLTCNLDYVIGQCEKLSKQIKQVEEAKTN